MANTTRPDEPQEQRGSPAQGDLASKLSQGANEVSEQAIDRVHRARDRLQDEFAQRRMRVSERIRDVSDALDGAGRQLGDGDVVAEGLHYVSERIERVAAYVDEADPNRFAHDLRDAVRERPIWFFGGAFVLGLALGRFAKSSEGMVEDAAFADEDEGEATQPRAPGTLPATGSVQASQARGQGSGVGSPGMPVASPVPREGMASGARPPGTPKRDEGARQP